MIFIRFEVFLFFFFRFEHTKHEATDGYVSCARTPSLEYRVLTEMVQLKLRKENKLKMIVAEEFPRQICSK